MEEKKAEVPNYPIAYLRTSPPQASHISVRESAAIHKIVRTQNKLKKSFLIYPSPSYSSLILSERSVEQNIS